MSLLNSEKITLIISIWILFVLIFTGRNNIELFLILIFIGIIAIREFADFFTSVNIKDRLNIFIYTFIVIFLVILGKKILTILSI